MPEVFTRRVNIYIDSGDAQRTYDKLVSQSKTLIAKETELQQKLQKNSQEYASLVDAKTKKDKSRRAELEKLITKELSDLEQVKKSQEAVTAQMDKQAKKITGELSPAAKELSSTASRLRNELNLMSKEDAGFAEKKRQYNEATTALRNYNNSLVTVKGGFKDLLNSAKGVAFGVLLGGGVTAMAQSALASITGLAQFRNEYESSLKNLSAITGAVGADLEYLDNAAVSMAANGSRSAREYVEAMKLIGSAKPELLKNKEGLAEVTKQAALLARASGLDLPEASKRLTDAMNQYGAPAAEAAKYVDALAAAAKYGAAEVPEITEALLVFGPVAKQSSIDIYESSAAIELLAEKGVKGAEAGTKLRNVFLTLSAVDSLPKEALEKLEKYGVNTALLSDKTKTLEERLTELSKVSGDANAMMQIFDKQNVVAGTILLENIPRYAELAKQIKETGVASQQAATNTGTLSGAWGKFTNAIKTLSLGIGTDWLKNIVSGMSSAVTWVGKLTGVIQSNVVALRSEQQELQINHTRITALNVGNENRTKLIQELQDKYPSFLANLNAEKATNEEISAAIDKVNNSLLTKITLAQTEERLAEAAQDRAEAENNLADAELRMIKELTSFTNNHGNAMYDRSAAAIKYNREQLEGLSISQQAHWVLGGTIKLQEVSAASLKGLSSATKDYNQYLDEKNRAIEDYNKIVEEQTKTQEILKRQLGITEPDAPTNTTNEPKGLSEEELKKQADAAAARAAGARALRDELKQIEEDVLLAKLTAEDREIRIALNKYEKLKARAREFGIDLVQIENLFQNEKAAIMAKFDATDGNLKYQTRLQLLDQYYADEKFKLKQALADEKITHEQYKQELMLLEVQHKNAKVDVAQDMANESAEAEKELPKLRKEANDADLEYYIATQEAKKKALKDFTAEELKALEQSRQNAKETFNQIASYTSEYSGYLMQMWSSIAQIQNNKDQQEFNREKKLADNRKKLLEDQLNSKQITQARYNKQVEKLDNDLAKKKHELEVKKFKTDQAMAITKAIIAGGIASMKAWADYGWPWALIPQAFIAGVTAFEVATIASQKPPEFKEGTDQILKGPSHTEGGIDLIDSRTGKKVGEAEGDEAIISGETTRANRFIIRQLLGAKGRTISFTNAMQTARFANGGALELSELRKTSLTGSSADGAAGNELAMVMGEVRSLTAEIKKMKSQKVIFVQQDYEDFSRVQKIIYTKTP